jgi:uncharacterized membrane protein YeaQ/YmgE (transglycosylase-associated protein family)
MTTLTLVLLGLSGALIGIMVGMALAVDFEYNKKYGKTALVYLSCAIFGALVFLVPVLIFCL